MYRIEDKASAIKNVQKYLLLNMSGDYDEKTRDAVMEFQEEQRLPVTGIVDYLTFLQLRNKYLHVQIVNEAQKELKYSEFPLSGDEYGSDIALLNARISTALERYTHEDLPPRGNYYSDYTKSAVGRLRDVFTLRPGTDVDEIFFVRLKRDIFTDK